ncbi:uncharacterized protein YALI1_D33843g [Yarrowia lipolytica]|uniref:Uncharacterized protein n=1 Tax=Yarrowia lipolytica TaxID=4952 RepID=A0A1D8NG71_YARLL|nr:hypothetical protein YALI1_D33843g [Yarrowia lipolytica]
MIWSEQTSTKCSSSRHTARYQLKFSAEYGYVNCKNCMRLEKDVTYLGDQYFRFSIATLLKQLQRDSNKFHNTSWQYIANHGAFHKISMNRLKSRTGCLNHKQSQATVTDNGHIQTSGIPWWLPGTTRDHM